MRLFIDTEFNEYKGELISIALVDENERFFYMSLGCDNPGSWVKEHVMPIIGVPSFPKKDVQWNLWAFFIDGNYDSIHIIADWPEDIQHFCDLLITGPGERINTPPLTMEVLRDLDDVQSAIPHNALEDAKAIRLSYIGKYGL